MNPSAALEKIAQSVARKVSPSQKETKEEKKFTQWLLEKLQRVLSPARLVLVGSTARDTGLHGDKDVDVFACFPTSWTEEHIVKTTVKGVKKAIRADWRMHYAEHPYLQATLSKYRVEVIPCFEAQPHKKIKSAVDRSPLHMDFLQNQLSPSQRQDVRALKQLLKMHGLYGAESSIKGFSGILCEYLVLHYHSFSSVIQHAKDWKPPVRIDWQTQAKSFDAPLTVIDAVDVNRNVAAVVSQTQLHRFISLAQILWKTPSEKLFFAATKPRQFKEVKKRLQERGTKFFLIDMRKPDVVEDILLPQMERTTKNLERQFTRHDFRVFSSTFFVDGKHAVIFIELENNVICPVRKVQGPPVINSLAVEQFLQGKKKVLRGPLVEEEHVVVEEHRSVSSAQELIRKIQANPVRFGVASHLAKPFREAHISTELRPEHAQAISRHLFKKEGWF